MSAPLLVMTGLVGVPLAQALEPEALPGAVDPQRIADTVEVLSGEAEGSGGLWLSSRHALHPDNGEVVDWLEGELGGIDGLEVWREEVRYRGREVPNLVAEMPGAEPERGMLIVSAHLDSTASAEEGWNPVTDPAPGADDDASGVAAVLELARLLTEVEGGFSRDIRFVLFNAEEVGLVGSQAYVDATLEAGEEVHLVLQLDPVGYNPGGADYLWFSHDAVSVEHAEAVEALAGELEDQLLAPLRAEGVDEALIGGDSRSDHYPFWQEGIAALHFASFPQPAEYHTLSDTPEVVDPLFTAAAAGLVGAYVVAEAEPVGPSEGAGGGGETGGCAVVGSAVGLGGLGLGLLAALWRRRTPGGSELG